MTDFVYKIERKVVFKEIYTSRASSPEVAVERTELDIRNGLSGATQFVEHGEWVATPLCPSCSQPLFKVSDDWHECSGCGWSEFEEASSDI